VTDARRGRNRITARALDRVATAVAADELGVRPKTVSVATSDDAGMLELVVSSPVRIPSLTRVSRDPAVVERTGGTLLERAGRAQDGIRGRVTELTGSGVSRVTVRLTGVSIVEEKRVG
jgi:hypothetical protein